MKFKIISGCPGLREINLAIERGEVRRIQVSPEIVALTRKALGH
jgi:hypothetical protein